MYKERTKARQYYTAYLRFGDIETQQAMILKTIKRVADYEYIEQQIGFKEFDKAVEKCNGFGGILVIAKLGKLVSNSTFLGKLIKNKTEFICCDNEHINPFTAPVFYAALKDANKKRRGNAGGLNSKRVAKSGSMTVAEIRAAGRAYWDSRPETIAAIEVIKRCEGQSVLSITAELNKMGLKTAKGHTAWHRQQVYRLIERIGGKRKKVWTYQ